MLSYGPGGSFGELALMYNCKRAATVRATAPSSLWTMDLSIFRKYLATTASNQMLSRCEFLRKVPLLADLTNKQVRDARNTAFVFCFVYVSCQFISIWKPWRSSFPRAGYPRHGTSVVHQGAGGEVRGIHSWQLFCGKIVVPILRRRLSMCLSLPVATQLRSGVPLAV